MSKIKYQLWYDVNKLDNTPKKDNILKKLISSGYTGIVLNAGDIEKYKAFMESELSFVLMLKNEDELKKIVSSKFSESLTSRIIFASESEKILVQCKELKLKTCYKILVDDEPSLLASIDRGQHYDYLVIRFKDPTNIPLELVIAKLQKSNTSVIKEIASDQDLEDAKVVYSVMEVGAEGIIFSPSSQKILENVLLYIKEVKKPSIKIQTATITRSESVGVGFRSCIDLATLFSPDEGMLIGSTSQGGILCCPEVFYLPYMELRPFRVNAGGVHSYVYNTNDKTDYMSELRAGKTVMITDLTGRTREAPIGRVKTEIRPLRLIEAKFDSGETINTIMQDDWHVRIFSEAGTPLNITELKQGDKVLACLAAPGRHVGVKVDENIIES